jgi:exopolyphosphatase/pppGpp-phosphohydrolase
MENCILLLEPDAFRLCHVHHVTDGGVPLPRTVRLPVSLGPRGPLDRPSRDHALFAAEQLVELGREGWQARNVLLLAGPDLAGLKDSRAFLHSVHRRTGVSPELLDAVEAGRHVYRAARAEHRRADEPGVVLHLELESLSLVTSGTRDAPEVTPLPLGLDRLHRAYGEAGGALGPDDASALFSLVRLCVGPAARPLRRCTQGHLAVSSAHAGAIRSLARALGYLDLGDNRIDRVALRALSQELFALTPGDLRERGVSRRLSPSLAAAAVIIDSVADLLGQAEVWLGTWGVPEGASLAESLEAAWSTPRSGLAVAS